MEMTLAALNDVDIKMDDIENTYLTAPIAEIFFTVSGTELGDDARNSANIVRFLYVLQSAGASFRNHLVECMKHL
jgi:hypothetical protein